MPRDITGFRRCFLLSFPFLLSSFCSRLFSASSDERAREIVRGGEGGTGGGSVDINI